MIRAQIALRFPDGDKIESDVVDACIDEQLCWEGVVLCKSGQPSAAMNKDKYRRICAVRAINTERLDLRLPVLTA